MCLSRLVSCFVLMTVVWSERCVIERFDSSSLLSSSITVSVLIADSDLLIFLGVPSVSLFDTSSRLAPGLGSLGLLP